MSTPEKNEGFKRSPVFMLNLLTFIILVVIFVFFAIFDPRHAQNKDQGVLHMKKGYAEDKEKLGIASTPETAVEQTKNLSLLSHTQIMVIKENFPFFKLLNFAKINKTFDEFHIDDVGNFSISNLILQLNNEKFAHIKSMKGQVAYEGLDISLNSLVADSASFYLGALGDWRSHLGTLDWSEVLKLNFRFLNGLTFTNSNMTFSDFSDVGGTFGLSLNHFDAKIAAHFGNPLQNLLTLQIFSSALQAMQTQVYFENELDMLFKFNGKLELAYALNTGWNLSSNLNLIEQNVFELQELKNNPLSIKAQFRENDKGGLQTDHFTLEGLNGLKISSSVTFSNGFVNFENLQTSLSERVFNDLSKLFFSPYHQWKWQSDFKISGDILFNHEGIHADLASESLDGLLVERSNSKEVIHFAQEPSKVQFTWNIEKNRLKGTQAISFKEVKFAEENLILKEISLNSEYQYGADNLLDFKNHDIRIKNIQGDFYSLNDSKINLENLTVLPAKLEKNKTGEDYSSFLMTQLENLEALFANIELTSSSIQFDAKKFGFEKIAYLTAQPATFKFDFKKEEPLVNSKINVKMVLDNLVDLQNSAALSPIRTIGDLNIAWDAAGSPKFQFNQNVIVANDYERSTNLQAKFSIDASDLLFQYEFDAKFLRIFEDKNILSSILNYKTLDKSAHLRLKNIIEIPSQNTSLSFLQWKENTFGNTLVIERLEDSSRLAH